MQVLVRVFYVSAIVKPLADVEVQVILGASQIWNRRRDVTGMLARSDGHFAQVVEGRREAIDALLDEPITRRKLAHWAMGLVRRDDMADEMRQLHEGQVTDVAATKDTLARLLPPRD